MRAQFQQALDLVRHGQPESVESALLLLQRTVFSYSMKVCGHREDAEDTMQETLLRAVPQLKHFDSPEALAVWLYKVARSRCLMSRRRSKYAPRKNLSLDDLMPDRAELEALTTQSEVSPEQALLRRENHSELHKAVLQVPPAYREILVMHDMEDLSSQEIAGITGLREGTVRVRLHRARIFLRNELARKGPRPRRRAPHALKRPSQCKQLFAALSDYLDQRLDPAMCEKLEGHLAGCQPCVAFLASLEETIRRCKAYRSEEERSRLSAEVQGQLRRIYAQVSVAQ